LELLEQALMMWIYRIDPRYLVLLFLCSFAVAGQVFLGFFQKWDAIAAAVIAAVVMELAVNRIVNKQWIYPLSSVITGLGISLLLSSHQVWPYVVTSILAISIKYMIRLQGKHLFNPNNVAMVVMLFFLPQYAVSTPKQWTNSYEIMVFILILGIIAAHAAKRLDTVMAFIISFSVLAYVRHIGFGEPILFAFGPLLGASFQLFCFFMITDPKTTPPTRMARVIFASLIALTDAMMRIHEITNSTFYAAFVVTLLIGVPYRLLRHRAQ